MFTKINPNDISFYSYTIINDRPIDIIEYTAQTKIQYLQQSTQMISLGLQLL